MSVPCFSLGVLVFDSLLYHSITPALRKRITRYPVPQTAQKVPAVRRARNRRAKAYNLSTLERGDRAQRNRWAFSEVCHNFSLDACRTCRIGSTSMTSEE